MTESYMRRRFTLLLFSALLFLNGAIYSQCIPDSSISALFAPNLTTGLPDGRVGVQYNTVLTVNVPTDTTYLTLSAVIDSMVLSDVTGLPPGFSYTCNPPSCGFPGGAHGCIEVNGFTDDESHAKTWDIEAAFEFYLKQPAITLPYNLAGYTITLDSAFATGLSEAQMKNLKFYIEPNPISAASKLVFDLPRATRYSLDIYSLLGTSVAHREDRGRVGENVFRLADFSKDPGVYFISINQGQYTRSLRFIVQ
ncbi:MAG: T9SS type A sorting domain-containing protein [Flavobacteriales bacterium]|nr:T9SS type A sorting domain-containing protein [Flavobacteriales bacterium]